MDGSVSGWEINQVPAVVAGNGNHEVAGIIGKGCHSSPTNNGQKWWSQITIVFTDHEGMVGGNSLGQESIGLSPLEAVGRDVYGHLLYGLKGIVGRACVTIFYSEPFLCSKVLAKYAKKDRQ